MFKTQLQELWQKKRRALPRYSAMKDGPDHSPRFKASVSIDGLSFHSPPSCKSFKQAQNEAARAALGHFTSQPPSSEVPRYGRHDLNALNSGNGSDEVLQEAGFGESVPGFYKNLLQKLAQREKLPLPVYRTMKTVPLQ